MLSYKEQAEIGYANDPEKLRNKAIAAGKYMDGRLKNGHFDSGMWVKFFDFDVLGAERQKLIWTEWTNQVNNKHTMIPFKSLKEVRSYIVMLVNLPMGYGRLFEIEPEEKSADFDYAPTYECWLSDPSYHNETLDTKVALGKDIYQFIKNFVETKAGTLPPKTMVIQHMILRSMLDKCKFIYTDAKGCEVNDTVNIYYVSLSYYMNVCHRNAIEKIENEKPF